MMTDKIQSVQEIAESDDDESFDGAFDNAADGGFDEPSERSEVGNEPRRSISGRAIAKKIKRQLDAPPPSDPWVWWSRSMSRSPAWKAMPIWGKAAVWCVMDAHLERDRLMNGRLMVTHAQFHEYGIPKNAIKDAVAAAVALGFLKVRLGKFGAGDRRLPNEHTLTWLWTRTSLGEYEPSREWKLVRDGAHATALLAEAKAKRATEKVANAKRTGSRKRQLITTETAKAAVRAAA